MLSRRSTCGCSSLRWCIGGTFELIYQGLLPRLPWPRNRFGGAVIHVGIWLIGTALGVTADITVRGFLGWSRGFWLETRDMGLTPYMVSGALILMTFTIVRLQQRQRESEQRASNAQREALRAQLEALRARTDPHFLFNSLNTVAALIEEDAEKATRAVEALSAHVPLRVGRIAARVRSIGGGAGHGSGLPRPTGAAIG